MNKGTNMFNSTKQDDLKDKAAQLANSLKTNVENVTDTVKNDIRDEAKQMIDMIHTQSDETKAQAVGVIESLKSLLNQYTSSSNIHDVKEQILDKAHQLTGLVKNEACHAYEVSRDKTVQAVHDKPIASLAIAVGAGVLLGYILGSKTHSK
jgi:ElaB/YqjD/DUF883 family membrane-anchored ribosome-binding protein